MTSARRSDSDCPGSPANKRSKRSSVSADGDFAPDSWAATADWLVPARRASSVCVMPSRCRRSRSDSAGPMPARYLAYRS